MAQGGYIKVKTMDGKDQKGCSDDEGYKGLLNCLSFEHKMLYDVNLGRGEKAGDIKVGFAEAVVRLDHFLADAMQDFRKAVPLQIEVYTTEKSKKGTKQSSMVLTYRNAYFTEVTPWLPDIHNKENDSRPPCLKLCWVFGEADFGTEKLETTGFQPQDKKADTLIVKNPTA